MAGNAFNGAVISAVFLSVLACFPMKEFENGEDSGLDGEEVDDHDDESLDEGEIPTTPE